ncbi:unnamed protein product [Brassica rapa subsp. narinosa]|uniref:Uncharacterized protein n=2 Tax=Brassica TaxID=3705 RepID=M4EFT2_BRACM|nr:unnamed protein product [Brassica napus]
MKNHIISLSAELTKKIETRGSSLASKCFCSSSSSLETSSPRPTKPSKAVAVPADLPRGFHRPPPLSLSPILLQATSTLSDQQGKPGMPLDKRFITSLLSLYLLCFQLQPEG